ncbi:hypothetical protein LX36DRAFT_244661 [Colletotrichum falcatum]|nr:hypothetical protein LX36DRAFT_244661 [Colletotrichum falcatum]
MCDKLGGGQLLIVGRKTPRAWENPLLHLIESTIRTDTNTYITITEWGDSWHGLDLTPTQATGWDEPDGLHVGRNSDGLWHNGRFVLPPKFASFFFAGVWGCRRRTVSRDLARDTPPSAENSSPLEDRWATHALALRDTRITTARIRSLCTTTKKGYPVPIAWGKPTGFFFFSY